MIIHETYQSHRERYYAWMFERQRIWYKRYHERSTPPWSDDQILVANRFTNTYRELDRGTLYALQHVINPRPGDTFEHVFMRTLAYRMYNKAATYDKIFRPVNFFEPWNSKPTKVDWDSFKDMLNMLHDSGESIFTNAHVVPTFGARVSEEERKSDKVIDFMAQLYHDFWHDVKQIEHMTFAEAHHHLMKVENLGDFLAYEVLTDLAYTGFVKFNEDEWANAGPGARDGLKLIFPEDSRSSLDKMIELRDQQDLMFSSLGLPIWLYIPKTVHHPRLTLRNIEGGLCEYYKYNSCVGGKRRLPFRVGEGYVWK